MTWYLSFANVYELTWNDRISAEQVKILDRKTGTAWKKKYIPFPDSRVYLYEMEL